MCVFSYSLVNSFESIADNLAGQEVNDNVKVIEESLSLQVQRVCCSVHIITHTEQFVYIHYIGGQDCSVGKGNRIYPSRR